MRLAPGIHRLGPGLANAYLLEEAGQVTIVDAGLPGYWRELPRELAAMGRMLEDVRAVVLTHAHSDHLGFAERIRSERGVPVRVHELDALLARGKATTRREVGSVRFTSLVRFLAWALAQGMLRTPFVAEVSSFGDGATLDVPGAPRVIHVPGHTAGSAALHVAARDAIFIGDAIVTLNVANGATGPRLSPFGADPRQARASLARLEGLDARLVLPGHGEPWTRGLAAALERARADS